MVLHNNEDLSSRRGGRGGILVQIKEMISEALVAELKRTQNKYWMKVSVIRGVSSSSSEPSYGSWPQRYPAARAHHTSD